MQLSINKSIEFSKLQIIEIFYNGTMSVRVGRNGVINIYEHQAEGEGDKWYYAIEYDNKRVDYLFNFDQVIKEK